MRKIIKISKKLILIIIFVEFSLPTFSQMPNDLMKYWYYRNRLNYFVVPGDKIGESQIVCVRNKMSWRENTDSTTNIDFGQSGKHDGLYIGVLATEYYLLSQNGQIEDASKTLQELYYSLYAVKTYWDSLAEPYWNNNDPSFADFDGFFIRGNIPCDFLDTSNGSNHGFTAFGKSHFSLLNCGLKSNDIFNSNTYTFGNFERGHPGFINHRTSDYCYGILNYTSETPIYDYDNPNHNDIHPESMSQDEAIGILLGCALAAELGDGAAKTLAEDMADKILMRVLNPYCTYGFFPHIIYEPDGSAVPLSQGGITYAYAPGFYETGYQITGKSKYRSLPLIIIKVAQEIAWQIAIRNAGHDQDLAAMLLAMGNYSLARTNNLTNDNDKRWETFYVLLSEVLNHKKRGNSNKQEELLDSTLSQLNVAPCEGPYSYSSDWVNDGNGNWHYSANGGVYAGGRWASDYRWFKTRKDQEYGDHTFGNFNGTDYMLLYNLYHIITKDESPCYVNYADKKLIGTVNSSIDFVGINSITSIQTINQTATNVNYLAGDNIHLKEGFHATAGSNFHAFIEDINCENMGAITPYYDSIMSVPQDPYYLRNDNDTILDNSITLSCPIDTIKFNGIFGDTIEDYLSYNWDFGNGQTSTIKSPKVFYDTPGNYNITIITTDTNNIKDTIHISINAPDCKLYGYLTENPSCGGAPVEGDSLYITLSGTPVATVNAAVTDIGGYFLFNSSQILQLDTTKLYTISTYSGISIDGMAAHPISYWIANSSLSLHYSTSVNLEWVARYNGADSLEDVANAIDLEGNVYVTGTTNTDASGYEILTIKYNPNGDTLWTKKYHGTVYHNDIARAITVDAYGNAYVAGESYPADLSMLTVLKYNTSGTLCWVRTYYRTNTTAKCIQLDNDGNIIVGGTHLISSNGTVYTILKYDPAGTLLWTKDYYGNTTPADNVLSSITIDSDNNVYATGYSKNSAGNYDIYTVKSDGLDGDSLWAARYNNPDGGNDYGYSNTIDSHENIIVAGYSRRSNNTDQVVIRSYNHNNGNVKWTSIYNSDTYDYAYKVLYNNAGYLYTAGSTGNATNSSMLALKYDTTGTLQWYKSTLPAHPFVFKSAALDQSDNLYVTGSSKATIFSNSDIVTQKLNSSNTVLWTQTYNGVGGNNDIPMQVIVSQNGNVYVCGESYGNNTNYDFTTIKYSQCESTANLLKLDNANDNSENATTSKENALIQVVPNPNNGNMNVIYEVPEGQIGSFVLYDVTGRQMMSYNLLTGKNTFAINGTNLNTGIYFYKAIAGNKIIGMDKIVVIK